MIQKKKFLNKQFNKKNNKYKYEKKIYNKKNNKYPFEKKRYSQKNNKNYTYSNNYYNNIKKPQKPKITGYLYRNKKIKKGIFFKKPTFNNILYPFYLNLKLINEYLKKK